MEKKARMGRPLSIKRTPTSAPAEQPVQEHITPITPSVQPSTGGIHLASATTESDPFRKSLIDAGYIILEENDYGCVCRFEKGKPTFIPKTKQGFNPNEKEIRISVTLPEHVDTAVKVNAARLRITTSQYLAQLIIADLRKSEDL